MLQIESALRPDAELLSESIERMGKASKAALSLKSSPQYNLNRPLLDPIPIPDDFYDLNKILPKSRYNRTPHTGSSKKLPGLMKGRKNTEDAVFDEDGSRRYPSFESNSNVGHVGVSSSNRLLSGSKQRDHQQQQQGSDSTRVRSALPKSSSKNLISLTPPVMEDPNEATGSSDRPAILTDETGDVIGPLQQRPPNRQGAGSRILSGATNRILSSKPMSVSVAPYDDTYTSELLSLKKQIVRESQYSRFEARAHSMQPRDPKEEVRKKRAFGIGPRLLEDKQDHNTLVELAHRKIEMYKLLMNAPNAEIDDIVTGGSYRVPSGMLPPVGRSGLQKSPGLVRKERTLLRGSPLILLKDRPGRMKVSAQVYSKQQKNYHEYQRDLRSQPVHVPQQRSVSVGSNKPEWWG